MLPKYVSYIIVFITICLFLILYKNVNNIENMATTSATETTANLNNEAIQNIASVYNEAEMKVTNLSVTNNEVITGNLTVGGIATITGNLNAGATATITGLTTFNGGVNIANGGINIANVGVNIANCANLNSANSTGTFVGTQNFNANVTLNGNTTMNNGIVYITSGQQVNGSMSMCGKYNNAGNNSWNDSPCNNGTGFSLRCNNAIICSQIWTTSTKRKKIILSDVQSNVDSTVLNLIRQILFYEYKHKDYIMYGSGSFYGVIAEQLAEVLPNYVIYYKEFIPNIYMDVIIHKMPIDTSENGAEKYKLIFPDNLKNILKDGDFDCRQLKCHLQLQEFEVDIHESGEDYFIIDSQKSILSENEDKATIFVYGSYEQSATVEKEKLGELALIGVKNLLDRVDHLENINKEIEIKLLDHNNKVNNLENKNRELEEKLGLFEKRLLLLLEHNKQT